MNEIVEERLRQDKKWGIQNHDHFRWLAILGEEYGEACKAAVQYHFEGGSLLAYRKELLHTAAVAAAAVECLDRFNSTRGAECVYLAGPIAGCTDEETFGWRAWAESWLKCDCVNPPVERDYRRQLASDCMNLIVNPDKACIDGCSIVLANCWRPSVGTSMEILYAWERGKLVVSVAPREQMSAWIVAHSHFLFHTLAEAVKEINGMLRGERAG